MKKTKNLLVATLAILVAFTACDDASLEKAEEVSPEVLTKLAAAGFNISDQAPLVFDEGYLVEGDIYIPAAQLDALSSGDRLPVEEQYSTNNLVITNGSRVVTIYAPEATSGGRRGKKSSDGYSPAMIAGLDLAIARYNAENLEITFQRVTSSSGADIVMTRLNKRDERSTRYI